MLNFRAKLSSIKLWSLESVDARSMSDSCETCEIRPSSEQESLEKSLNESKAYDERECDLWTKASGEYGRDHLASRKNGRKRDGCGGSRGTARP